MCSSADWSGAETAGGAAWAGRVQRFHATTASGMHASLSKTLCCASLHANAHACHTNKSPVRSAAHAGRCPAILLGKCLTTSAMRPHACSETYCRAGGADDWISMAVQKLSRSGSTGREVQAALTTKPPARRSSSLGTRLPRPPSPAPTQQPSFQRCLLKHHLYAPSACSAQPW